MPDSSHSNRGHSHSNASLASAKQAADLRAMVDALSDRYSSRSKVDSPAVLERDSRDSGAPPAVTPTRPPVDPSLEPPVRPPGAPSWLRIGGKGARARYAAGEGKVLWTGKERRVRLDGSGCSQSDVRKVLAYLKGAADRPAGAPVPRVAVLLARWWIAAGRNPKVLTPTLRRLAA